MKKSIGFVADGAPGSAILIAQTDKDHDFKIG